MGRLRIHSVFFVHMIVLARRQPGYYYRSRVETSSTSQSTGVQSYWGTVLRTPVHNIILYLTATYAQTCRTSKEGGLQEKLKMTQQLDIHLRFIFATHAEVYLRSIK